MIAPFRPSSNPLHQRTRASFDHSPMLCFYEVTRACDLVCQHCRACAQPKSDPGELTTAESKLLIDQLAQFPQPPMLILTGGDPLKRADLFELIRYSVESGLEVSITPSPTPLVTAEAIARLRDAGISRMAISIDGADAATHDANRGVSGSYEHSMRMLATAADLGVSTQINTTLTPANVDQIETMADQFAKVRTDMWSVFFLIPVGRAAESDRLNADQCEAAFERLYQQSLKQPYRIKTTEAMHYRRFIIQKHAAKRRREGKSDDETARPFMPAGINDGKGVMFVSHIGVIHPTGFLPVTCGVFPRQSVVDVYQNSPVFQKLRDASYLEGKCGCCEFNKICGGSRARAYGVTGNMFAEDPDCCYLPSSVRRSDDESQD
ncbi:TIGR04053 family radical SAM/SPASM domain-containing protein [Crateriforma conspicua]|uniref:Antilisterial bacteriocin subtilosin biosynthesis protein AlbA n=1 Tax=Crateriforma conspicua TaxID=2527996 RepID=A0A5C5YB99_9PLAN|nr:TIGR04053 family radical SAM/SPASM domain-containing protein [Crateriforma conspicua]QDV61628.1 Antilisterial bacteriocin subtilosin biosynthesis protein AlbA [Crateriforma conspicua]TWT72123.1 Antilisterial bacteriocin subtilosin biosynthesis protein AlbA [Crateriforma conspicua]